MKFYQGFQLVRDDPNDKSDGFSRSYKYIRYDSKQKPGRLKKPSGSNIVEPTAKEIKQ